MKRVLLLTSATFSVTLAIILGLRVSTDALAVMVGVILGILASLPMTLLLAYFLLRHRPQNEQGAYPSGQYPPVVVINGGDKGASYGPPALPPTYAASGGRKWTVIGEEETGTFN